ncbi:Plexin-A4 [Liparis tanakae]|uniref:Plexin-A4 n=1 Tax=Liparis tanakae TaxID=230148 RepID=A0A4Z2HJU5_9TELE|nr:Plexin-A4 [Liparis tanakae]
MSGTVRPARRREDGKPAWLCLFIFGDAKQPLAPPGAVSVAPKLNVSIGECQQAWSLRKLFRFLSLSSPPNVTDNAVMALVPKQVTAYNSVNNSTVSRTSARIDFKRRCDPLNNWCGT